MDLPFRLHATSPYWIPPLKLDRYAILSPRLNAFFRHAEAQLFLARRGRTVVGRISAHIDRAYNDFHDARWGWFGFFECEEDPDVASALLETAAEWLRARGCARMVGPADFTMNDDPGILIEGFDREPMIRQPWHPPGYRGLVEGAGLTKAIDLLMWELHISDREKMLPVLFELADKVEPVHGIRLRKMERRHLRRELETFGEIYNEAWKRNWGFVPFDAHDLDAYAQELQLVFDRDWFMLAERIDTGEAVALAITIPDVNQVLKRMHGRLLPLGWWEYLKKGRTIDRVRVGFLGVKPEYQHTGVAAALYVEHFNVAARTRRTWGEMGWILESNTGMNRGMEAMGGRVVKRYRMYQRALEEGALDGDRPLRSRYPAADEVPPVKAPTEGTE